MRGEQMREGLTGWGAIGYHLHMIHFCSDELRILVVLLPLVALVWANLRHAMRCVRVGCRRLICRLLSPIDRHGG